MKRLVRGFATFAAIALLLVVFYRLGSKYIWPPDDTNTIATVGIIEAPEVNLTSRIAGRIQRLDLLEGDHVGRGQVVCQIEDVDIRNQLAQANGQLADAEGDLHDAERTMARYSRLFAAQVISAKDRDDAVTHIDRSRGAVAAARASVRYYADQLADTTIRSPITGIVVSKNLEVGEWVTPGTAILTIDDLSTIWARVDVEETDLASIKVGGPGQVTIPGSPPGFIAGRSWRSARRGSSPPRPTCGAVGRISGRFTSRFGCCKPEPISNPA